MGQLLFKKMFFNAIRDGSKRTTIRRWSTPRLKAGQRAWTPGVGWLAIESVEPIARLDRLTDADAHADGFESASAMRAALRSFYPQASRDGRAWFRIAFRRAQANAIPPPVPTATPPAQTTTSTSMTATTPTTTRRRRSNDARPRTTKPARSSTSIASPGKNPARRKPSPRPPRASAPTLSP